MSLYFGSDNSVGASAPVMQAILEANQAGPMATYGSDPYSQRACEAICKLFECQASVFFVPTGTGANALALAQITPRWGGIFCTQESHIAADEANAVEYATGGARLFTLPSLGGKLEPDVLASALAELPNHPPHNAHRAALSLTNLTEGGRAYTPTEVKALTDIAKGAGLLVHMDGARFANAIASVGCAPADVTWRAGVDVLGFGATKGGAQQAEAIIFFNEKLAADFDYRRKQAGQLVSKSRYMGAQFSAWLENGHWLDLSRHANQMATDLSTALTQSPQVRLLWPVDGNEIFAVLPRHLHDKLQAAGVIYYEWPSAALPQALKPKAEEVVVRFVTSWQTTSEQVQQLIGLVAAAG